MAKQLSLEQIVACGIDGDTATAILPTINQWLTTLSAADCWQCFAQHTLSPKLPFAFHQLLYTTTFSDWDMSHGLPPAWFPSNEQIEATHLFALMQSLQIHSYPELHAWSVQHRAKFWEVMIQRLGIRFQQRYTKLLDLSGGVEFPQWLTNARFNIVESCFQAPENAPAILFQPEGGVLSTLTYGQLHTLANRVANGLIEAGFQRGDRIAIAMPMTAESVAIYLGIIQMGGVVVSIADSFAANEIATRLQIAKAKAIFTQDAILRSGKCLPLYTKVIEANAPMAIVLPQDSVSSPVVLRSGDRSWEMFLSSNAQFNAVPAAPAAHTNILFSSGTTGHPKAIPWTQTTPIKCAADGHLHHDIHAGDVVAWYTNLGWMMGPWLIYASLINQATIALYYGTPNDRAYGQFIQDATVTMLGVVPSLVNTWKTTGCMQGLNWSAIKAFSSTGECSNPQDMLFLMSLAGYKPIVEYCGGTEIGGGYITGTVVQPCVPSTFTTPALGLDLIILDEAGHPAPKGEAFIIPPSIGLSTELLNQDHHQVYFADTPDWDERGKNSELNVRNAPSMPPISLRRHGDYLERLSSGYYRAHGRVDDAINLNGIKVSSSDIERALTPIEAIAETAAIAVAPRDGGPNQLVIYAVLAPGVQMSQAALKTVLQKAIAQYLNPLFKIWDVVIVEALPRTASNKVMRRVLRDHYQQMLSQEHYQEHYSDSLLTPGF